MRRIRLGRPSPATVLASISLFVALGGTSYAVATGSIDSREIKNNSLRSADVRNGSLVKKDIKRGVVPASTRWALIGLNGQIEKQSGGFEVEAAYSTTDPPSGGARNNVYIDTGQNLSGKGVAATVALQNMVDQGGNAVNSGTNAGPDANPEFSGEISASKCNVPGLVMCAPQGTNTDEYVVVSPRNSDGSGTTAGARKRFYVVITP